MNTTNDLLRRAKAYGILYSTSTYLALPRLVPMNSEIYEHTVAQIRQIVDQKVGTTSFEDVVDFLLGFDGIKGKLKLVYEYCGLHGSEFEHVYIAINAMFKEDAKSRLEIWDEIFRNQAHSDRAEPLRSTLERLAKE